MKYRYLGSSGLLMSRITLGTMTFGAPDWGCDEKVSHAIIKQYLDAGGNTLDIADIYAGGRSEEIVGNVIPELNRDGIIIASKCSLPSGPAVTLSGVNAAQPTFTAPEAAGSYALTFQVAVNDGTTTTYDTVTINVTADDDAPIVG